MEKFCFSCVVVFVVVVVVVDSIMLIHEAKKKIENLSIKFFIFCCIQYLEGNDYKL